MPQTCRGRKMWQRWWSHYLEVIAAAPRFRPRWLGTESRRSLLPLRSNSHLHLLARLRFFTPLDVFREVRKFGCDAFASWYRKIHEGGKNKEKKKKGKINKMINKSSFWPAIIQTKTHDCSNPTCCATGSDHAVKPTGQLYVEYHGISAEWPGYNTHYLPSDLKTNITACYNYFILVSLFMSKYPKWGSTAICKISFLLCAQIFT